jgi:hypothetical protein
MSRSYYGRIPARASTTIACSHIHLDLRSGFQAAEFNPDSVSIRTGARIPITGAIALADTFAASNNQD